MNLFKVYSALAIFLVLCTYKVEGGILLLLILKIIALKGALFFGFPLAIGSFILGQGVGFLGGTAVGGFGALHAVVKHHKRYQRPHGWGWRGGHHAPHHHHHGGWGWGSRVSSWKPEGSFSYSDGWGGWSPAPPTRRPSLLASVRDRILNHILGSKAASPPEIHVVHQGWPGPGESGWTSGKPGGWDSGSGGQSSASSYYDTHSVVDDGPSVVHYGHAESDSSKYEASQTHGSYASGGGVDYAQGLMNYLKTQQSSGGAEIDSSYNGPEVPVSSQYVSAGAEHQPGDIYGSPQPEAAYGEPQGSSQPEMGVYDVQGQAQNLGTYNYYTEPSAVDNLGYGAGADSSLQGSEESVSKIRAPNSVIQSYLEKKLKEEMAHQKSAAQKKEAAELIAMLRQAYIQELVESLREKEGDAGRKSRANFGPTMELPNFVPFPSDYVPNSTTAKPKRSRLVTLRDGQKGVPNAGDKGRHVRILADTPKHKTGNGTVLGGNATRGAVRTAGRPTTELPTRFVPLKTSILLNKRSGLAPPAVGLPERNRRQAGAGDIQALTAFADDIKKFFLLVSVLDQDKCLQKLVCEVHAKTGEAAAKLTPYESNILITFKVMNVLLPANSEDSTTHYRAAAKIGELSKSTDICAKAYASCTFSSAEIVNMGNQVAATGNVEAVTTTVKSVLADLEASDGDEAESAPVPSYAKPVGMPKV